MDLLELSMIKVPKIKVVSTNDASIEILPCPFCGNRDIVWFDTHHSSYNEYGESLANKSVSLVCDVLGDGCGCQSMTNVNPIKCIESWNKRT